METENHYNEQAARKYINEAATPRMEDYGINRKMLEGDHWNSGLSWSGALPTDPLKRQAALVKIKALFTSQNVMLEVLSRHISGVLGKDPEWYFLPSRPLEEAEAPTEQETALIRKVETEMTKWWYDQRVHKELIKFTVKLLAGERAVMRVYIPSVYTQGGGVDQGTFEEQLPKIRIQAIEPGSATVKEFVNEGKTVGYFQYKLSDQTDRYELTYLNDAGETVITILGEQAEYTGSLGGRLSMYEANRRLFLTQQIREQNHVVNKAHTQLNGNLDTGFLERTFLNAQPPGHWDRDDTGHEAFHPAPLEVGAGRTNFISGVETIDEDGKRSLTTPQLIYREPINPSTFVESKDHAYRAILEEARQKHALIAGDASPSGESRVQALGDFLESLNETKSELEDMGLWIIETVAAMAFDLAGEANTMEILRGEFRIRVSTGPLPATLRAEIMSQYEKGLLPREDAMSMLGVDDVDAAISRMDTATERVTELLTTLDRIGIKPPTLVRKLFDIMQEDQEILSELEDKEKTDIQDEINQILEQSAQERDIFRF